jgi:hypothetical protein
MGILQVSQGAKHSRPVFFDMEFDHCRIAGEEDGQFYLGAYFLFKNRTVLSVEERMRKG